MQLHNKQKLYMYDKNNIYPNHSTEAHKQNVQQVGFGRQQSLFVQVALLQNNVSCFTVLLCETLLQTHDALQKTIKSILNYAYQDKPKSGHTTKGSLHNNPPESTPFLCTAQWPSRLLHASKSNNENQPCTSDYYQSRNRANYTQFAATIRTQHNNLSQHSAVVQSASAHAPPRTDFTCIVDGQLKELVHDALASQQSFTAHFSAGQTKDVDAFGCFPAPHLKEESARATAHVAFCSQQSELTQVAAEHCTVKDFFK